MASTYELTILLPDNEATLQKNIVTLVSDFVKKVKGEVVKHESWGSKELAYPVAGKTTGVYEHFVVTMEAGDQPKLDKELRLREDILRYLFITV